MLFDRSVIYAKAQEMLDLLRGLPSGDPISGRTGGYFLLGSDRLENIELIQVGTIPDPDKNDKYERFCQEKAHRLIAHRLRKPNEAISSWQTRNEPLDMYGGAVLLPVVHLRTLYDEPYTASFSGFPEFADEAFSVAMGYALSSGTTQLGSESQTRRIIEVSGNPILPKLLEALKAA
jgi:hypothetical protein